jgi:DNA invertase Pin-like site-specific DNA recombinase
MSSAIGYVRLSQESDTSIDRQQRNIETYADEHGFDLETIYSDGQKASGFDGDRPEYEMVVESVRGSSVDAVIVNDKRRLTRDVDEAMRLIPDFRENHVQLHTCQDGSLDLSDPIRAAIEIVSAAAAHEEKMQEIEKAREATCERVEDPNIDHGRPRFGMTYDDDGQRQVPGDRFDDVREILELRDRGWTLERISDKVGVARSTVYRVTESTEWYANRTEIELTEGKT